MAYQEITCSAAFRRVKGRFPFHWDLNPYRGCGHGCKYCFAVYSHRYLESDAFFDDIYVKTNIVEELEKQLRRPSWTREVINIGGVTDSYQQAEAHYRLMPEILRLLIQYKNPCIISTKSDLILRDFDLIARLAELTYVNVACTITCMDESIRRLLEPGGAPSRNRFGVLEAFSGTRVTTGLHVMPIIPFLTDTRENLAALYASGREARVSYVLPGLLYLRGNTRQVFFSFIQRHFPGLYAPLQKLYGPGASRKAYKAEFYRMERQLRTAFGLQSNYHQLMRDRLEHAEGTQLSFFDLM